MSDKEVKGEKATRTESCSVLPELEIGQEVRVL